MPNYLLAPIRRIDDTPTHLRVATTSPGVHTLAIVVVDHPIWKPEVCRDQTIDTEARVRPAGWDSDRHLSPFHTCPCRKGVSVPGVIKSDRASLWVVHFSKLQGGLDPGRCAGPAID